MDALAALIGAASEADANVIGGAILRPDREAEPGWYVVTRADGSRVRLDTASGGAPTAEAVAAVLSLDTSPVAVAALAAQAKRAAAVASLMTAGDPISVAVRAFVRDLYTQINDLREINGLPRTLEPDIVGRVVGGIVEGLGDAGPIPPA